jgi:hypothetical protein
VPGTRIQGWLAPGRAGAGPGLRCRVALIACLTLAGCSAPDPVKVAKQKAAAESVERAASRLYKLPYDTVWEALVSSAAARKLSVVQADAASGVMELRHGVSATSPGERVDVRVTRTIDEVVRVEIRSRALVSLSLAPDWQRLLFGDLEQKIAPRRRD